MNARILGLVGLVAAAVVGCKSDPTNSLVGTPARVGFQFRTVRLTIADSLATFAVVQDEGSNPLVQAITVTACDPTTVSVVHVASGAPEVQTNFFIKGIKFGTACVVATSGGLIDSMQVATVPDQLKIATGPDTVLSGDSGSYTFVYLDKAGNPVTGVPVPTWSSATPAFGAFAVATTPNYVTAAPGVNTLTASVTISALAGTVTQTVATTKVVATIPGIFPGTFTSLAALAGRPLVAHGWILPTWDADATVTIGGTQTFVSNTSADSVSFVMLPFGATTKHQVLFTGVGPTNLAAVSNGADSVAATSASLDGSFAPGDSGVATTVFVTLPKVHGDTTVFYDTNHGTCINGGSLVGGTDTPGDHCNALFGLFNNTAGRDTISAKVDWVWPGALGIDNPTTTQPGGTDQDMYLCDSTCSNFVGAVSGGANFGAAGSNTPEATTFFIPANTKVFLLVNLFNPAGQPALLFKVTLSHK